MLSLPLLLILTAAPPVAEKPDTPPASDMAILYFLAGDLRRAVDTARAGLTSDPKKCKVLYPMLVEYAFLVPKRETFSLAEAKSFLDYDKKISPKAQGKLTANVVKRYVELPLQSARTAHKGGDLVRARQFVDDALAVDATNADAIALKAELGADAGR